MSADDLTWVPPGPGQWYASPEHMPEPVTTLFAELFPQAAVGWASGAERYGLPPNHGIFGDSNRWFFYSPGMPGPVDVEAMEQAAAESLTTERWRHDLRRWRDEVRPQVLAENRALLAEDLGELDDAHWPCACARRRPGAGRPHGRDDQRAGSSHLRATPP